MCHTNYFVRMRHLTLRRCWGKLCYIAFGPRDYFARQTRFDWWNLPPTPPYSGGVFYARKSYILRSRGYYIRGNSYKCLGHYFITFVQILYQLNKNTFPSLPQFDQVLLKNKNASHSTDRWGDGGDDSCWVNGVTAIA